MNKYLLSLFAVSSIGYSANAGNVTNNKKPNVIVIMCDDMGYSDLSCYGSEIHTPHIDYLAEQGVRFSQFKNTGRSCPSRAALLTGCYQHEAEMGWMTAVDEHRPGYRGQISSALPTIAEIFKDQGYTTYMSGKWHVTLDGAFGKPNGSYPTQRGFDKYYGCLSGGGSYYTPKPLYTGLTPITELPDDYYYTNAISDSAVSFVRQHPVGDPMFMYVAHYAPHRPLQAPENRIEACRERYKVGYDILRQQRLDRMKGFGLIDKNLPLPVYQKEFDNNRPAWTDLTAEQQEAWIREMSTYAAMIEIMDDGIGRLIAAVKEKGMLENTVFLFMSDNGATNEGDRTVQLLADLSNTPYRCYKQWCYQGGTSAPFILMFGDPRENKLKGGVSHEIAHIIDVLPTCLDASSIEYPSSFQGKEVHPAGISLLPAIQNKKLPVRDLYFEHQSSCAIISDGWKLVRRHGKQLWELIYLTEDPFETVDLSSQYPDKVKELEGKWNHWAEEQHVLPFEYRPWTERINYYKSLNPDQSGVD